eukprot:CAMPEP_0116831610 /NCGR_PEP_ID=MMETSP0418-20121206/5438_1 /TAXON_ID=1158023 /ORGANISM="Astrosyne radiata, Strain 13vi08-1A" /LENGTH=380 /DNA_ID=CAMNT_0004460891 /DNA_START=685 /DNA_END=1827 /DNA_ORIENTATION=+
MERSNRILSLAEYPLETITESVADCLRVMSVQAEYLNEPAGAALFTPEQVEMHLYLWKSGENVCVEIQRRRGDSVAFHRYARHILDAAGSDFDSTEFHDYGDSHYLKAAEKLLKRELRTPAIGREESTVSLELTASLLEKDRLDARLLGMESLCILTDPRKTHMNTALLASRAVLLGTASEAESAGFEEDQAAFGKIHEFLVHLIQKRAMIDEDDLLDGMDVDYDSDDEDFFGGEEKQDGRPPEYTNTIKTMTQYALTILANSWEVVTNFDVYSEEPETAKASSVATLVQQFLVKCAQQNDIDMAFSLLEEMNRAARKPHNACLAAKSLRIMLQASKETRERAVTLGAAACAKRAYEVGSASHARLESEAYQLLSALNMP